MWNKWLGDQWSIGDWPGMLAATPLELPERILRALAAMMSDGGGEPGLSAGPAIEPPQNLKEYDPEWGRAFWTGARRGSGPVRPHRDGMGVRPARLGRS
jgi:hypothetical protein